MRLVQMTQVKMSLMQITLLVQNVTNVNDTSVSIVQNDTSAK